MTHPVRLQLTRQKGFNLQAVSLATNGLPALNVGRPGVWGNPFVVGEPSGLGLAENAEPLIPALSLEDCLRLYRSMILGQVTPEMFPTEALWRHRFGKAFGRDADPAQEVLGLRGKNLACWCGGDHPCHADVLLELANRDPA
jgi:hypothetical protein